MATALLALLFLAGPIGFASAAPSDAGPNPPAKCFVEKNFELPTCSYANGEWTVSYPGDTGFSSGGSGGIPAGFVVLMVLVPLIGLAATVWRVSMARRLARGAGMDPDTATAVTLIGNPGLDATYLAANLRGKPTGGATDGRATGGEEPAEERLTELKGLLDKGLITQAEYDTRRSAIVNSI